MQVQIDKSSGLKSVFKKLRFRGRLVWIRNKTAFSNISGVVCMELKESHVLTDGYR